MSERTIEWWEKQAGQYKAELDALNPRLNVAEARIKELEATAALLERDKSDFAAVAADTENRLVRCEAASADYAQLAGERLDLLTKANAELVKLRAGSE